MDRESHRAAVDAGYADLSEYIKKWGEHPDELILRLRQKPPTFEDFIAAADEIERLNKRIETLQEVVRDQHAYGVEQLKENDRLLGIILKIKQESNEDHIRAWAHGALNDRGK